jgi:hypothetical protein
MSIKVLLKTNLVKVEEQVGEPDGGREVVEDVAEAESNLEPKIQRVWICHF